MPGNPQSSGKLFFPELRPAIFAGTGLAFGRCLGEYGSIVFIAGNKPYYTEITPLIIMSELQEFDYSSATAIALVMLAVSFFHSVSQQHDPAEKRKNLKRRNA